MVPLVYVDPFSSDGEFPCFPLRLASLYTVANPPSLHESDLVVTGGFDKLCDWVQTRLFQLMNGDDLAVKDFEKGVVREWEGLNLPKNADRSTIEEWLQASGKSAAGNARIARLLQSSHGYSCRIIKD